MRSEFNGSILVVREAEDCIRATKKYTKGAFSKPRKYPVQGEDFPSVFLTEYYEVYPDTVVGWNMSAVDAWAWIWGDVIHIDVLFQYDYRSNKAKVIVRGGTRAVDELVRGIPGLGSVLSRMIPEGHDTTQTVQMVGDSHRVGTSTITSHEQRSST